MGESTKETTSDTDLSSRIATAESSVVAAIKADPFQTVTQGMIQHPELGRFVTQKMAESVSLEAANSVGEATLIVYNTIKALATAPKTS